MRVHLVNADRASWREWQTASGYGQWGVHKEDPPKHGDTVVGVLAEPGRPALVMDVSTDSYWSARSELVANDWDLVDFPLRLSTIWEESGLRNRRLPALLKGREGNAFADALDRLRAAPNLQREGRSSLAERRQRSKANRDFLIARHTGFCPCCARDLGAELPGGRGLAALQVHHLARVGAQPGAEFDTALEDLAVLCATCHVLAAAGSASRGTDLHPDALRQLIRPGSRRRCIRCGHGKLTRSPSGVMCTRCSAVWRPQLAPNA